jgi:uncharacterized protein (TIGR03790 family)
VNQTLSRILFFGAALFSSASTLVHAANPGNEAIVVFNSRAPESKQLAYYYARRRQVPPEQVFGLDLPNSENMSRAEFQNSLQKPLAKLLEDKKLWHVASVVTPATTNRPGHVEWRVVQSKIRYAVLCYGVPLRISEDSNLKEPGTDKMRPEMRRNGACVDSELTLLPLMEQRLPLHGTINNLTYGATNTGVLHPTNGVLLVSRLDGPTPEIARGLVDKAIQAETDGLWGRAYFDLRNISDPAFKIGDDWIRNASEMCRRFGFETVVDHNPATIPAGFPMSQIAIYIGWYSQDVNGPLAAPSVEFMPGAFAYHLHSYSAASLRATNRFWTGPLLAKGATITMGCIDEPFLGGSPDVAMFTARLMYNGFSFGEAACACQNFLSWQTTVVGDPLYRPFAKSLEQLQSTLAERQSRLIEWAYLRFANLSIASGKQLVEAASLLEELPLTKTSAVLTEKLGDLYAGQGKPSSSAEEYKRALKLDPTSQQRLRLLLTLGDRLVALNETEHAYENYQALLRNYPSYADKLVIVRKLLPLAQKLNRPADVQAYQSQLRQLSVILP